MSVVGAERVCVALDRASADENIAVVRALAGRAAWFKVGLRQYYAEGAAEVLAAIRDAGAKLFLDLKLHDIPKTVGDAAGSLRPVAPDLLTVHASGGSDMVRAAVDALAPVGAGILAVTVLTSLDGADLSGMWGISDPDVPAIVERLGRTAVHGGAAGLVCSALEAAPLRAALGEGPLLVTPGIRPAGAAVGDQKRVMTPARAIDAGASLLVVGRPIHGATDPAAAFDAIVAEQVAP